MNPSPRLSRRTGLVHLAAVLALSALPAMAQTASKGKGKVVLSVTGAFAKAKPGGRVDFDMAALAALPQRSFTTGTPWFKAPRQFTGPLLRDLLAAAGAQGQTLVAVALNDYKVEIPAEDAGRYDVIVARLLDGKPMPTRDKGPLFIIYPFDSLEELRSERYYGRSAWQLRTLEVK